jgi:hypothetical protein
VYRTYASLVFIIGCDPEEVRILTGSKRGEMILMMMID